MWDGIFNCKTADEKAKKFHEFLTSTLDKFFSQKEVKRSPFDKKWFNPSLKIIHRRKQREYFKNRRSEKFKKLQRKFNRMKKVNIKSHYVNLTEKLKVTNPRNYFKVIKMLSGYPDSFSGDCEVEELRGLTASDAAEKIADHFSAVSCSYQPVQLASLPAYLPAPQPPQVTEVQVYNKLNKLKHTRSTFPIDLPFTLRKEYAIFLAAPLADIFNTCLSQSTFPDIWKMKYVTPIQKVPQPKRKITFTQNCT